MKLISKEIVLADFFKALEKELYALLKMPETFPEYYVGSDLDILCHDITSVSNIILSIANKYANSGFVLDVNTYPERGKVHIDITKPDGTIEIRFDLFKSLSYFKKVKIKESFALSVLENRQNSHIEADGSSFNVCIPSDVDKIIICYLEYLEYYELRPDKIKHYDYVLSKLENQPEKIRFLDKLHLYTEFAGLEVPPDTHFSETTEKLAVIPQQPPQIVPPEDGPHSEVFHSRVFSPKAANLPAKRTVIAKIYNGLGNQMFQYALGRHLALLNNAELKLDITAFATDPLRKYELHNFAIVENFASVDELALCTNIHGEISTWTQAVQGSRVFEPQILELRGNIYLDGYWQNENYFKSIRFTLLKEFTPRIPLNSWLPDRYFNQLISDINATESIALHVRRGDYVSNPATTYHHGVLPVEYYRDAVSHISARVPNPVFFIFSDDPRWTKENIKPNGLTFYLDSHDTSQGHRDLELMKHCKHFVIANSSFSWWGAWLSRSPRKIVIAPQAWFANPRIGPTDIVPRSWIRI